MKISPRAAISRLGERLRQRREEKRNRLEERAREPVPLDEDLDNISVFGSLLDETIALIDLENRALETGETARVALYFKRKEELLGLLSVHEASVAGFIRGDHPEAHAIKEKLRQLSAELKINANLLSGVATASHTILAEVDRIRKRQSLEGVYDKDGQLRKDLQLRDPRPLKKI